MEIKHEFPSEIGPGEARTHQRRCSQLIYIAMATIFGGTIDFATGFFDRGDGNLFAGDWEDLKLPPLSALGVAALPLGALVGLPLYGFRMIDDYKREQNLIAFTGGCLSVMVGFPISSALNSGGFALPPHALGIFAIAYMSMQLSFGFVRWRM